MPLRHDPGCLPLLGLLPAVVDHVVMLVELRHAQDGAVLGRLVLAEEAGAVDGQLGGAHALAFLATTMTRTHVPTQAASSRAAVPAVQSVPLAGGFTDLRDVRDRNRPAVP
jgi:hypothetical protein